MKEFIICVFIGLAVTTVHELGGLKWWIMYISLCAVVTLVISILTAILLR